MGPVKAVDPPVRKKMKFQAFSRKHNFHLQVKIALEILKFEKK
jgi:hypothetical protein